MNNNLIEIHIGKVNYNIINNVYYACFEVNRNTLLTNIKV